MQYTNSILDPLVTIGYNMQLMVAYRSTGMELQVVVLFTQVRRDSALRFVAHSILYYDNVEA